MKFLNKLFDKKKDKTNQEQEHLSVSEFWDWFVENQARLWEAVKTQNNIEFEFINPVFNKLNQVKEGAFLLVGMMDDVKAELVLTAEGRILLFPFITELIDKAPKLDNWEFTAFKPAMDVPGFGINLGPKSFSTDNIFFYPENDSNYPDEISLKLVYSEEYSADENELIENGLFIFIENYIGELKAATQVDILSIMHQVSSDIELNPISKINDYINWREKEFIEKYQGTFSYSDEANYSSITWENGDSTIFGVVNADLLNWDKKASHPWIMIITIIFDEKENNGMPNNEALQTYYQFEDKLKKLLPVKEGHIHVGQATGLGKREIYYANKDFVKPIKILEAMKSEVNFDYEIDVFIDKYWKSMRHFEH